MMLSSLLARLYRPICGIAAVTLWLAATSAQAKVVQVAYFMPDIGSSLGELVDWDDSLLRARVTTREGARDGGYTDDGSQRVVTLDQPFSAFYSTFDRCGELVAVRNDVETLVYRSVRGSAGKGSSELVSVGRETVLEGCDAGQVTVFGSIDDPGTRVSHLSMNKRPALSDLLPGLRLAGVSRDDYAAFQQFTVTQDIGRFLADGQMQFEASGKTVSTSVNGQGWLTMSLNGVKRGYTRLSVDEQTGQEVWFAADFADGRPLWVAEIDMVRAQDGASFGSKREAARHWIGAFTFIDPYGYDLYRDGSGHYFNEYPDGVVLTPLTWKLPGDIRIDRSTPTTHRLRTWTPLARTGTSQWVMEREVITFSDGTGYRIYPRVNYYTDGGRAVPQQQAVSGHGVQGAPTAASGCDSPRPRRAASRGDSAPC